MVIDASTPHPKKNFHRQLLKIVDPSMNYKYPRDPQDPNNGCVSVTFFASSVDQLPMFKRVGDIIRIHRANIGTYKNFKTFSVNLAFGSSWVIFSGFGESCPPPGSAGKNATPLKAIGVDGKLHKDEDGEEAKSGEQVKNFFGQSSREERKANTASADANDLFKVAPFKASSKEYSLSHTDYDIVTSYRKWLAEYFEKEFNYESTLYMNLNKVKDLLI